MGQASDETSPGRLSLQVAIANKQAADPRALDLVSTVREAVADGFISRRALAGELNRRGIPTARGGRWHYTTVVRMLTRLGMLTSSKGAAADARATALAATIRGFRKAGIVSSSAIARELNLRGIPTARASKWRPFAVTRLLQRLENLDRASRSQRGR
jgi:hypothetical protein